MRVKINGLNSLNGSKLCTMSYTVIFKTTNTNGGSDENRLLPPGFIFVVLRMP